MTFVANFSTLVDIAFVGFVSFACWKSMKSASQVPHAAAEAWRNELKEVEKVLRTLIDEAGEASAALDRRLVRRKEEIETLLKRAESASKSPAAPAARAQRAQAPARPARPPETTVVELEDDLPNDSWGYRAKTPPRDDEVDERLDSLISRQADSVKLSQGQPPVGLTSPEQDTFAKLSLTDPIAYKIARRLLAQGAEIHVVARKLDVPLSEIRMLDRLMRDELAVSGAGQDLLPQNRRTEPVPESKIVRSRPTKSPMPSLDVELTERDELPQETEGSRVNKLDYRIERASALL